MPERQKPVSPFNRTIVELKRKQIPGGSTYRSTFNRTIVELKLDTSGRVELRDSAFNRTIVELKLVKKKAAIPTRIFL